MGQGAPLATPHRRWPTAARRLRMLWLATEIGRRWRAPRRRRLARHCRWRGARPRRPSNDPGARSGGCKRRPWPRAPPQLLASSRSSLGPLGFEVVPHEATGASLEKLGPPWARATSGNTRRGAVLPFRGGPFETPVVGPRGGPLVATAAPSVKNLCVWTPGGVRGPILSRCSVSSVSSRPPPKIGTLETTHTHACFYLPSKMSCCF